MPRDFQSNAKKPPRFGAISRWGRLRGDIQDTLFPATTKHTIGWRTGGSDEGKIFSRR